MALPSKISITEFHNLVATALPFAENFKFCIEHLDAGYARGRMVFDPRQLRPGGTLSGPAIMALGDYTMYAVVLSLIGQVELAVTTNLTCNFLLKPRPVDLLAEGRIIKLGKRLAYGEVLLRSEGGEDLVAHITATYSIPPTSL
ncbi:MAG: PaaI family thioesterase [Alphaproteobacteria bacterium]